MSIILQPLFIVLLFALVRSGDIAITSGVARDWPRAVFYGVVAVLALVVVVLALVH